MIGQINRHLADLSAGLLCCDSASLYRRAYLGASWYWCGKVLDLDLLLNSVRFREVGAPLPVVALLDQLLGVDVALPA